MGLDIRLPIGMMFTLIGLMLAISGFLTKNNQELYQCSLGININLIWGVVLLIFGGIMLTMAAAARCSRGATEAEVKEEKKEPALR